MTTEWDVVGFNAEIERLKSKITGLEDEIRLRDERQNMGLNIAIQTLQRIANERHSGIYYRDLASDFLKTLQPEAR